MIPLAIIRPEPGAAATVRAARALGLDARAFPLFAIAPRPWDAPPRADIDALLLGSANALRHAGAALADYAGMPAYAVGETTAQAARDAGLRVAFTGSGGLQGGIAHLEPGHRRLLRLCGETRVALEVPAGFRLVERACYASVALPMPPGLIALLRAPVVVALHSAEAARHFAAGCADAGLDRGRIALACLAGRVATAAGSGWRGCDVADRADDAALLALAARMCQSAQQEP